MPITVTDAELQQIKAESSAKGIEFDDRQLQKIREILERRLARLERTYQRKVDVASAYEEMQRSHFQRVNQASGDV